MTTINQGDRLTDATALLPEGTVLYGAAGQSVFKVVGGGKVLRLGDLGAIPLADALLGEEALTVLRVPAAVEDLQGAAARVAHSQARLELGRFTPSARIRCDVLDRYPNLTQAETDQVVAEASKLYRAVYDAALADLAAKIDGASKEGEA